ncbi:PREDICTED: clathrin interactor EPSIN 3-like isoform X2 [Lupinus angustifolius]|uniref:clathrin interactor EPSIN 3-like isoform X2 n=1 Tax=Lupinus angustifolius TaxID=3871 RepID=UPI00092E4DBD|nr:PREDICTED: clathrin interactor EPSIN 3-like isoform X2 [Lupinus angustifolius]
MKKVIGQTVRDLKREVNKKVLKVPGIEQKVLDATSNEPWGPHGTLLADIAQATRNPHEYQMIMAVIWKRINDTGKNWRHVYKALTVLEYLVANGSERVIDEIREHAYQTSTLSDFQYIDSSGRDQGNNVRRKSQSLVLLVNDKERIVEVRQKAATNRDKFHNNPSGGMYRPGSYSNSAYGDRYDDDRHGSREEDRNGHGYGREREGGYKDDDRSSRDGDRYSRDYEERNGKDGYRDDDYRGRSPSADYQYESRSRSSDRDRDRSYEDDGHSSRGSNAKPEDRSLEARLERKISEQSIGAPPSYEEAVGESQSPVHSEKDVETSAASAPRGLSPHANDNPSQTSATIGSSPSVSNNPIEPTAIASTAASGNQEIEAPDDFFDPRVPQSAAPATSNNVEMDLLGSLSDSFALVLMPATSATETPEGNANTASTASFAAPSAGSSNFNQSFEDPFGDSPFKAVPSTETAPSQPQTHQSFEPAYSTGHNEDFGFGDSFSVVPYSASGASDTQSFSITSQFPSQDLSSLQQETDILADILPPAPLPGMTSQHNISAPAGSQPSPSFLALSGQMATPFSEPTGELTEQSFLAITSQPTQGFSPPVGQFPQQAFSAPNGQPGHAQSPFSAPIDQPGQLQSPFSAPNGQPGQLQYPFSALNNQPGQLQSPFSASNGQPGQVQSPFSAPSGQPGQVQTPFSAPTSQYGQQPFSSHAGQPNLHGFSLSTGQSTHPPFASQGGQPAQSSGHMYGGFNSQGGSPVAANMSLQSQNGYNGHMNSGNFLQQAPTGQPSQSTNFPHHGGSPSHTTYSMASHSPTNQASQFNNQSFLGQQGSAAPFSSSFTHQSLASNASQLAVSTGSNSLISQPPKAKFETKSTVWADTLSKGLVNLNISGPKTNPLADIGIDFESINRKEKRMEKPTTQAVTSTVTMGQAMGSGSGIGRAGAGAIRSSPNPSSNMGSGMGMGMGMGNGMGMGGYGGMNPSMGMSMGNNMGMGMGMTNMGMGQGVQMQPPTGYQQRANMQSNYNPMMGPGGYSQQPYGGYR